MRTIAVDFESYFNTKEGFDIKALGSQAYCLDSRSNPYLISVSDGADSWAGHPRDFNWDALRGEILVSHNAGFDSRMAHIKGEQGVLPKFDFKDWYCTANLSMYLCMRRDLARASEFLLGVEMDKSYREDADGRTWEDIVSAGKAEKVKSAGRADALRCHQIWSKYSHLWPQLERDLSALTIRQARRGIQIDFDRLKKYLLVAQTALIQAESVLPWMKEGKKPTSPKAVAEQCRRVGIPAPPVKSRDGEEVYDEWAATYAPRHQWVKAYTDYRVLNKFITTLETIRQRMDPENLFYFDLLYFGAHTGRWSGSGGYNMQNMRKDPLFIDTDGWLITDPAQLREIASSERLPDFVAHSLDIRALFIARPGRKLIISDLSQIEPRVLAWLVGDRVMLDSMALGQSPYEAHARATMNWTGGDMKKENKELYALAKARVLGLGYGCGGEKFITVAHTMAGLDITKDDPDTVQAVNREGEPCFNADGSPKMISGYGHHSRRIVNDYRNSNPLITGLWEKLDDSFRSSEGGDFSITLPSGRQLRYPSVKRELKAIPDPENPKRWRRKMVMTALAFDQKRNGVVRKPFYGGLLTENLVQAAARDVFGEHLVALQRTSGIDVLFSVHDEAVNEVDETVSTKEVKEIMSVCPPWLEGCPIAADVTEAPHYLK